MRDSSIETPDWSTLPRPTDDGAARHLVGLAWPAVPLRATDGTMVEVGQLPGLTIVYAYPRTGKPGIANPDGWDMIPGARGCTPQSCAFRDHFAALSACGINYLFGLSTQTSEDQQEVAVRLHLPFLLLSDAHLRLTEALALPTFSVAGQILLKRFTLVIHQGQIIQVFYPIFPPDQNATQIMDWLKTRTH